MRLKADFNIDGVSNGACQLKIKARARAVAIHRREKNLSGAKCHGATLQGGTEAPALSGAKFWEDWKESTVDSLLGFGVGVCLGCDIGLGVD